MALDPLLQRLQDFISRERLFVSTDQILLACSGGIDSMVLAHLLHSGGWSFAMAHVNFHLRGEESNEDARFVEAEARSLGVPFYKSDVSTLEESLPGESIQMTARRLRYEWLEQVRRQENFQWVATAHHADDDIETFFLNVIRGSGISGLSGIPVKRARIIRPLLFASREEINHYAQAALISWREDRSNAEDKYDRNWIRHHLIPLLNQRKSAFSERARWSLQILKEGNILIQEAISHWEKEVKQDVGDHIQFDLSPIQDHPAKLSMLFHWLKPFGFGPDQVKQALYQTSHAGGSFFSNSHELLVGRNTFRLRSRKRQESRSFTWEKDMAELRLPDGILQQKSSVIPSDFSSVDPNQAYLDPANLDFPLRVRRWKNGDRFQPLGMEGKSQKVQDFFTHQKLDRWEKEKVWILETAKGEICWIVGMRLDHRFRMKASSDSCLLLTFNPEPLA